MNVVLNGEPRQVPEPCSVRDVLQAIDLDEAVVAVAVNETFVPKSEHAARVLQPGDRIEVVAPMAGG